MDNVESNIEDIFEILNIWMKFPNYQLERRADIYFAKYLPVIMKECDFIGEECIKREHIIPEFPLKHYDSNRSNKVDYAVFGEKALYFIELKTTMDYIKDIKITYLIDAKKDVEQEGVAKLIDDIRTIKNNSGQKEKYQHLLDHIEKHRLVERVTDKDVVFVFILPLSIEYAKLEMGENKESFKDIEFITFEKIIKCIPDKDDQLAKQFCASLGEWEKVEKDKLAKKD